ncbi:MAG TPA: exopolysaccharide biosynthesis protein [Limnochordales bacterium]
MADAGAGPASVSERLRRRLKEAGPGGPPLTLGEVVDLSREHGFGLLFAVLALPTLVPVLPPGTAAFIGLLFAVLGLQRAFGLEHPWLPARLRRLTLSPQAARFMDERVIPILARFERSSRGRLGLVATEPLFRAAALSVTLLGLLMVTPLPFFNTLPALLVLMVGIGFLRRDGLYILVGMAAGYVLVAVVVGLVAAGLLAISSWPWR